MTFSAVNTIWVLLGAALVFFMQAGFAMCEAGFTRAKNTGNILMKNLMDFCIGTPLYWLFGYGIMFGAGTALFGWIDPFIMKDHSHILPAGVPLWAYAIFQTVFCATSATIVSGAMAERTKFSAYCVYSAAISLFIYPVSGHWIWGGGWLADLGFHDFAGSTCVHMVGGVCALIGAKMLGPRIGKYGKDGKPRAILGHNLSIAALGVFILWFCWFGFNGASTVGMDSDELIGSASLVFFNTNLAAAVATLTTMVFTWLRYGKPDVSMTFNAALAGLVGITAGCDAVNPFGAALIGLACGFVIVFAVEFFDKVVKIDDLFSQLGEEPRIALFLRRPSDDHGFLPLVQCGVAGCAIAHAAAQVLVLPGKRFPEADAGCQNHRLCFHKILIDLKAEVFPHRIDHGDLPVCNGNLHLLQMIQEPLCQLFPGNLRKTGIIPDLMRL